MNDSRRCFAFFLAVITLLVACSEQSKLDVGTLGQDGDSNTPLNRTQAAQSEQNFSDFFAAFALAVANRNSEDIAQMTRFPFELKGELDGEGQVYINEQDFLHMVENLLNEQVFIAVDDDLLQSSYREVILKRTDALAIKDNEVQLHGLLFRKQNNTWAFSEMTTHVHIVEKYAGGG